MLDEGTMRAHANITWLLPTSTAPADVHANAFNPAHFTLGPDDHTSYTLDQLQFVTSKRMPFVKKRTVARPQLFPIA